MNCKEGDLAILVSGNPKFIGSLFRCIKYLGYSQGFILGSPGYMPDAWTVEPLSPAAAAAAVNRAADSCLRPLPPAATETEEPRAVTKPKEPEAVK